jgi:hypothetical protein
MDPRAASAAHPDLSPDEDAAMEVIIDAMRRIENLNGRMLRANNAELTQAIHVLQSFVIQSACGRLGLFGCNDGWWS